MMLGDAARRVPLLVLAASLVSLGLPGVAAAHSELVTASPDEGTIVPSPFTGPIVLTFSEHLATGSKADLIGPDASTVAKATVDADAKTMSFALTAALDPGAYEVRWVSVSDDSDVLRQPVVKFTVAPAPSPSPSPAPTATPQATVAVSAPPSQSPTAVTASSTPAVAPTAAPSSGGAATGGTGDVVLPILVALLILGVGAAYLLLSRRNRPTDPT